MTWAVLATGESMSQELADKVGHLPCVAVSDAFVLAPRAKALVAADKAWWKAHPEALAFAGEKWCGHAFPGTHRVPRREGISGHTNSGLLGLDCAVRAGASRVLLLGIDLTGTHFFGAHTAGSRDDKGNFVPLKNTPLDRFDEFRKQFAAYSRTLRGVEVLNCSPVSTLTCFPRLPLDEALECCPV